MRTRLYLHRRLKRLLCRHVQLVSLTGAVLLIVCVLILIRSPHRTQDSVDVEFYHLAEAPNDEPYRKLLANIESKSFENGRNRTVKTAYGPVYVRDILFVPEKPLAKGANVYKVKRDRNESTYQFSRPADQVELDKVLQELNFSQEKKNRLSKLLGKAESRKSLEALGPRASRKLNQELEGSEFLKRRNREVVFSPSTNTNSCKPPCMQYLTSSDAPHYKYCRHKANLTPDTEPLASTCSFREHRPNMPLVALASPRGSGADHLRWYLQEVTGLCTGSINCNSALRRAGFVGEGIRSVSVLVVKTDQAEPVWSEGPRGGTVVPKGFSKMSDVPMFDGAVYLLRNPFHCLIQEWNDLQHASLGQSTRYTGRRSGLISLSFYFCYVCWPGHKDHEIKMTLIFNTPLIVVPTVKIRNLNYM